MRNIDRQWTEPLKPLTEGEQLTVLMLRKLGHGPLEPEPVKRVPYDDLYLWRRQNFWSGGLGTK
jgi:hypothetical protein